MNDNYDLAKWLNDEMTDEDLKKFQSHSDYSTFEKIKNYSSQLETSNFNDAEMLQNILSAKKENTKVVSIFNSVYFKVAAILIIALGILFSYQMFSTTNVEAQLASKTNFLLPDNSEVVLNADSKIEYKKWNWKTNRNLNLKGEAYFKVAKGQKFTVHTNLGDVCVLGTQFNVKSRNNRFDVTCYEGKVKVTFTNKEIILIKGKTISIANNLLIIDGNSTDENPVWMNNQIGFDKENLSNIIDEIKRNYNVSIIENNKKTEQLFTGKLPANNLNVALEIIASSYHLKIKKINPTSYSFEETN